MEWASGYSIGAPYDISLGDSENLLGYLHEPPAGNWLAGVNGKLVTFVFTAPNGSIYSRTFMTWRFIFDGAFQASFVPTSTGTWSVYVQFDGDVDYIGSKTSTGTFYVAP
jgi:hypothetical protein